MRSLAGFYAVAGNLAASVNLYDGVLLIKGAEDRATEVVRVAMVNPRMMKIIDQMIEGNVYFNLVMGHGIILMAILMNHGRIPSNPALLMPFGLLPEQVLPLPQTPSEEPVKKTRRSSKRANAVPV
jgi:hypothetical protein